MEVRLPRFYRTNINIQGNEIRQIGSISSTLSGDLAEYNNDGVIGWVVIVGDDTHQNIHIFPKAPKKTIDVAFAIVFAGGISKSNLQLDLTGGTWIAHPLMAQGTNEKTSSSDSRVRNSWIDAFSYVAQDQKRGVPGLRSPQLGALHAVHAHWSTSAACATIVMPTGTGKTDTMLSIMVSAADDKILVLVPTDALRSQLAEKFISLGVLKNEGSNILAETAQYPIVGVLNHKPKSTDEVDDFFGRCNVVITTSQIAGQCPQLIQDRFAQHCPYLFIDEAHHAEAPTWKAFKERFSARKILQFTATPFREDDKLIDGKIIYRYPLRKAQQEDFFRPIKFISVFEFNLEKSDETIAAAALEALATDSTGKHILMARVKNIGRAKEVAAIYKKDRRFNVVEIHTGIKSASNRQKIKEMLFSGEARVVVCVDMLGEGFDLPELKIAAFHDIRKSLAVTLQLAGRFTRSRPDLGDACFIANIADITVVEELRRLYVRDPDWNVLLPQLSDEIIEDQISEAEFAEGFNSVPAEIPLSNIYPAASIVVYKTDCERWDPERFRAGMNSEGSYSSMLSTLNEKENTLVIVTSQYVPTHWTDMEGIRDFHWELHILVWDPDQNLLFINSSENKGQFRALAEAVAGQGVTLIEGNAVFRCLAGITRLRLSNVGLTQHLGRLVRYTGRMGADIETGLADAQKKNAKKSVLFGSGYKRGGRATIGASRKGRIWSHSRLRLKSFVEWSKDIGAQVIDTKIDPDTILKGTLESITIAARPESVPIGIDWPEEIYSDVLASYCIVFGNNEPQNLHFVSLELETFTSDGPLKFKVWSDRGSASFELGFSDSSTEGKTFSITQASKTPARILHRSRSSSAEAFFQETPPTIWFADGASLEGNLYTELKSIAASYNTEKIEAWDWTGIDLKRESQGSTKRTDSIQYKVISHLKATGGFDIIFDDDGSGECADVVSIKITESNMRRNIDVDFYHCKFTDDAPGRRVDDLYVVCGQAQKSIYWMFNPDKHIDLFTHLLAREANRLGASKASRLEFGTNEKLIELREMSRKCRLNLRVFVVQPGLSKLNASEPQLELLGVTESFLSETYSLPFTVIGSP